MFNSLESKVEPSNYIIFFLLVDDCSSVRFLYYIIIPFRRVVIGKTSIESYTFLNITSKRDPVDPSSMNRVISIAGKILLRYRDGRASKGTFVACSINSCNIDELEHSLV